jgi:hypothetical protein
MTTPTPQPTPEPTPQHQPTPQPPPTTPHEVRAALADHGALDAGGWLPQALDRVAADPAALAGLFPAAGRRCGRGPLPALPGWSADEAARALLLTAVPADRVAAEAGAAYRYGDAAEKRAVLKALPLLPLGDEAVPLLRDALRTNDTRLVSAALGRYARHLDDAAWRDGVLKCVFMGVPLTVVDGLDDRADSELAAMLGAFARERRAAGRDVPADAVALLDRVTLPDLGEPDLGEPDLGEPDQGEPDQGEQDREGSA